MGRVELVVRNEGQFHRAYARKRLRPHLLEDEEARAMFVSEARIAGLLHHPNVVSVIDVGEDAEGPFLVMDYVQGMSLSELLKALAVRGESMPIQIVVRIFLDVARGLSAAHELRDPEGKDLHLVHRDVSPQNVLVGFDGVTRLTDFGIAKAAGIGERTSTGVLKGKFGYFAPEQLQFLPASAKSDLFALGVVLFETLTGRRLYRGDTPADTARKITHEPPPDPFTFRDDLHPDLVALLFRLLAKKPEDRPSGAGEVASELEGVLAELRMSEPPRTVQDFLTERFAPRAKKERAQIEALTTTEAPPQRRRAPLGWLMAAAAIALTLGAGGTLWLLQPAEPQRMPWVKVHHPREDVTPEIQAPIARDVPEVDAVGADGGSPEEPTPDAGAPEVAESGRTRRRRSGPSSRRRRSDDQETTTGEGRSGDAPQTVADELVRTWER